MATSYLSNSNNKKLGTDFENEAVEILNKIGYWVHFIAPDIRGAQPFDVIAVKESKPIAIDCKTSAVRRFNISRLEDNQVSAFEKWLRCGNPEPIVLVKHNDYIYCVGYLRLRAETSIRLKKNPLNELEVRMNELLEVQINACSSQK